METGMVFGIIFAIIMIALLLVFGMDQIVNIFCVSNTAQTNKAVKDLENAVEDVFHLAEGSAMPFKIAIPRNAELCLINYSNPSPMNNWNPDPDMYNIIRNRIQANQYNVWINYGCGTHEPGYRISYLRVSENFCVGLGEELYIENKGHYVSIEKPM
ncbi:MAG: hypothetical protein DRO99_04090 [Candidatus Aenigmatarchaeota archaeon]|nr:MAG: hypothetical protein DRO99_04090 [Candidatus Aenigmarchaeota archaeon]